jgi:hypothetical protein
MRQQLVGAAAAAQHKVLSCDTKLSSKQRANPRVRLRARPAAALSCVLAADPLRFPFGRRWQLAASSGPAPANTAPSSPRALAAAGPRLPGRHLANARVLLLGAKRDALALEVGKQEVLRVRQRARVPTSAQRRLQGR